MPTDPETLLPTDLLTVGAGDVRGIQAAKARYEFVEHDFNRFVELDRSGRSVATLAAVTDGELEQSIRHRVVYAPNGLNDELRLLARSGNSTWALGCLVRASDRPVFTAEKARYVASVARGLGVLTLRGPLPELRGGPDTSRTDLGAGRHASAGTRLKAGHAGVPFLRAWIITVAITSRCCA